MNPPKRNLRLVALVLLSLAACTTPRSGGGGEGEGSPVASSDEGCTYVGGATTIVVSDSTGAGASKWPCQLDVPVVNLSTTGAGFTVPIKNDGGDPLRGTFLGRAKAYDAAYEVTRVIVAGGINDALNGKPLAGTVAALHAFVDHFAGLGIPVTIIGAAYTNANYPGWVAANEYMATFNAEVVAKGGTDCGAILGIPLAFDDGDGYHVLLGYPQTILADCVSQALAV